MLDHLRDRDILYAFLTRLMPWTLATAATEEVLQRYGTIADAMAVPEAELAAIASLGPAGASLLKAVQTVALRLRQVEFQDAPIFRRWDKLVEYLVSAMARETTEVARVLFLDTRNRLLADEEVARGDVKFVHISVRQILKRAIELQATALIIAHNHPSGDPTPSDQDIDMTRDLSAAAKVLDIAVHDHIIVGRKGIFSFRKTGFL